MKTQGECVAPERCPCGRCELDFAYNVYPGGTSRAWPEADPSYQPTEVPAASTRHCWLRLRSHKKTGAQRIADDGHVFTTCARCGRHYVMLCPGGCVHDRPA